MNQANPIRLIISRAFSTFGMNMYLMILPLIVLDLSNSLQKVSLFFAVSKIPSILLTPLFGILVDKVPRKKLILFCNGAVLLFFSIQWWLFWKPEVNLTLLIITSMALNLFFSISDIATRVIFTEIVAKTDLEKVNGIKSMTENVAAFAAPMIGTILYGWAGVRLALAVIMLVFIVAATPILILNYQPIVVEKKTVSILSELTEGLQYVKSQRKILAFFVLVTALNFFVASTEEVINPGIVLVKYGISKSLFGLTSTFYIAGVILAGIFIVKKSTINFQKHFSKLFIGNSLIMILLGTSSLFFQGQAHTAFYPIFLFLELLLGFVTILVNVPLTAYFQGHVPLEFQGRFFAFFSFAANLSIPLGIFYSGILAENLGADVTYILNNLLVILIVVVTYKRNEILSESQ